MLMVVKYILLLKADVKNKILFVYDFLWYIWKETCGPCQ